MSKIIIQKMELYSDNTLSTLVGTFDELITDSLTFFPEKNDVVIEDGQTITESYNVPFEMRMRKREYADNGGTDRDIFTYASSPISTDGDPDTKYYIKLVGVTNGYHIELKGGMYVNGYLDFSNGRLETVLQGNIEVESAATGVTSNAVI